MMRDGLWRTGSAFQNTPFCGRAPHCWRGRAWNAERPVAAVCILHSAFRILDLRAIKGDREYGMQCKKIQNTQLENKNTKMRKSLE